MELTIGSRLKNAWNAFKDRDLSSYNYYPNGSSYRPDRTRVSTRNERSIALDVASIDFYHCRLDNNDRFKSIEDSDLNNCLSLEANIDQTSRAFIQDVVISMFDEGCVAIVPVDTIGNPLISDSYKILTMRVGRVVTWYPDKVTIELYNDRTGYKEQKTLPKKMVCIIENPLYSIMNEPNSTLQRLIRKLVLLDSIDEQSSSGKLDLIIQLPYVIKSQSRKDQAEQRRKDIENQLKNSKYGIAYTDGTEKITQLNRPLENNLMKQVEYLTSMLYGQLGITQGVMDGTADEKTMTNYYSRTIEPIAESIALEMNRKFLTKTARSQKQQILYFRDPFKLVPVNEIAEIADKFTRNEILSSNEVRQVIGRKPSDDPKADQLINSNINQKSGSTPVVQVDNKNNNSSISPPSNGDYENKL